jgi:hypothetical protein
MKIKRLFYVLFVCVFLLTNKVAKAQPNFYFNAQGSINLSFRMLPASNLIQYQYDSVSTYNSPQFRSKIVNTGYDSISGLSFEKQYFFRCRYVNANGDPTSNWSQTTYNTATYPLEVLFKQTTSKAILSVPIYRFLNRYSCFFELWYDTVASFNSSQLKKISTNTLYTYHKIGLIKNKKEYYLRARVVDGSSALPWKTIHVQNDFKPTVSLTSNGGCTDTSIAYFLIFSNYFSDAVSFSNKTYVQYGSHKDSFTSNSYGVNIQIKDTNSIYFYCKTKVQYDSAEINYTDTQAFRNLLSASGQISYLFRSMPQNAIYFMGASCNTNIELELYSDSTLMTLLKAQTKSNGKINSAISFDTDWDYFKKNVLRYRSIRFGVKSEWTYIYPRNYAPSINHPIQAATDTTTSKWTVYREFLFPGKKLEVLLDVNSNFNSPKLKSYTINDSSEFYLESLFDSYNYVKCRITDGVTKTNWSKIASKPFTAAPLNNVTLSITHPTGNLYTYPSSRLNGVQVKMGTDSNNLRYNVIDVPNMFMDTFDFVSNDKVYFKLRRYTGIDTSIWSKMSSFVYKANSNICMSPVIVYNGNRFGKDTFDIRWKERDPGNSIGNYLYFAKSPTPGSIGGIIEIPKGINFINLRRRDYPIDWYYAVYPKCGFNKTYSQIATKWFPLNPLVSIDNEEESIIQVYYNYEQKTLLSNTDFEQEFEVYDLNGKTIRQGLISKDAPVDLSMLGNGIYIVKLTAQNNCQTFKIVVL